MSSLSLFRAAFRLPVRSIARLFTVTTVILAACSDNGSLLGQDGTGGSGGEGNSSGSNAGNGHAGSSSAAGRAGSDGVGGSASLGGNDSSGSSSGGNDSGTGGSSGGTSGGSNNNKGGTSGGGSNNNKGGTGSGGTSSSGGISGSGGTSGSGGSNNKGGAASCEIQECLRANVCLDQCGGKVVYTGCCACTGSTVEELSCDGATGGSGGTSGDCVGQTCAASETCVAYRTVGGALFPPDSSSQCPAGRHLEGTLCQQDFVYTCADLTGCSSPSSSCRCATGSACSNTNTCRLPAMAPWLDASADLICELQAP